MTAHATQKSDYRAAAYLEQKLAETEHRLASLEVDYEHLLSLLEQTQPNTLRSAQWMGRRTPGIRT